MEKPTYIQYGSASIVSVLASFFTVPILTESFNNWIVFIIASTTSFIIGSVYLYWIVELK